MPMSISNAILLGLLQGVTEFLPVSASGHMSVLYNLFGMTELEVHSLFDFFLNMGTFLSVCIVFRKDIARMFLETSALAGFGPLAGQQQEHYGGARLFFMLLAACLPLLLVIPVNGMMSTLYGHSVLVGFILVLNGWALYVADRMTAGRKSGTSMSFLDALLIGLCRCVAVIPGLSPVGIAATAGLAVGLKKEFAVRFSLLMCLPSMLGASIISLASSGGNGTVGIPACLFGMVAAAVSGVLVIGLLRSIARKGKFGGFAYYCWVIGVLSVILSLIF